MRGRAVCADVDEVQTTVGLHPESSFDLFRQFGSAENKDIALFCFSLDGAHIDVAAGVIRTQIAARADRDADTGIEVVAHTDRQNDVIVADQ